MVETTDSGPTPETQAVPGILWFIFADVANFVLFFAVFMFERFNAPDVFAQSAARLDVRLGLLNTVILISSGWLVAVAVQAARQGNAGRVRLNLILAIVVGACFAVVKAFEYNAKFADGITLQTNLFFTYYFVLTGIHLLHLLIGIIFLAVVLAKVNSARLADESFVHLVTAAGLFWHMVDLLWIFLFAMFYLQGVA